jgi:glycerol-3-phosphate acyltransferase PlsY
VTWSHLAWVAGAYVAGTLPSTWLVSRSRNARSVIAESRRTEGEADAHVLMRDELGMGWAAVAAVADVLKALLVVLAAREWGHLSNGWLAATGVAVVAGHAFPFYRRAMAGRGVAAAAGVLLVVLPVEMAIAGALIVVGLVLRTTSLGTTVGLASVPVVAAARGQPGPFVALALALFALILGRRLEGVGVVVRAGVSPARALWYRAVFDSSGPPRHRTSESP